MSPFKTVLSFVIIALLGYLFIPKLSVDLVPNTQLPVITLSYSLSDAPPEILEQQATGPLENALSQISQVKKIYSVSGYGQGSIEITFDKEVDIAFKKFEASSIVRQVYKKLNSELSYPVIEQRNREDKTKSPLLVYRINAKLAPFQIRKTAEDILVPALSRTNGVYQVALQGAQEL
jgi:multidrug efflux pump subunit AcrB